MENLTHTLFGAALAAVAVRPAAPPVDRRLFVAAGALAANLPDIDILYTAITAPAPLGYLLHHRGHTHTFAGAAAGTLVLGLALAIVPAARALAASDRARLWMLVAAGVLSHVLLDWTNSYGVHPFYPFDNRWYYGDAVFVIEPVFWVLLGAAVAAGAGTRRGRHAAIATAAVLPVATAFAGLVPWTSVAAMAAAGGTLATAVARRAPAVGAAAGLLLAAAFTTAMFGVSRLARAEVRDSLRAAEPGRVLVDLVLTPNPSSPACWAVVAIERRPGADALTLRRGTFSFAPSWRRPESCALHQDAGPPAGSTPLDRRIAWRDEATQPLAALRALALRDCRVNAWLRFGRAPILEDGRIYDLRFENPLGANFTSMAVGEAAVSPCPALVPPWGRPRADVLE